MDDSLLNPDLTAKARIRNNALDLFSQHGASGTSMRSIAEAAGVTVGLITHHFGTKALLVEAVEDEIVRSIASTISINNVQSATDDESTQARAVVSELNGRLDQWARKNPTSVNYIRQTMLATDADVSMTLYEKITALTREQVLALRARGYASSNRTVEQQVLRVLFGQLGRIFLHPLVERVSEELDIDPDTLTLSLRVQQNAD